MREADTIVVVEDDPDIADLIELYLRRDGFEVAQASSGERALAVIAERDPVLVVLDLGLDGSVDGVEVCRRLRTTSRVPVMMVTARDDEIDRIVGLEVGADDYVVKPFSPRELLARIRAVLRRVDFDRSDHDDNVEASIEVGDLVVDRRRHEVRVADVVVALTAREYSLLLHLAENPGRALTRRQLLDGAWEQAWIGDERTIDVHVRQLRRKLGAALPLTTVRGVGYRFA